MIASQAPVSFSIGSIAFVVALVVGIGAGTVAALYRNTVIDRALTGLALTGISVPVFVVAPVLILAFAVHRNWLPASWTGAEDASRYVLPVIALALPLIAYIARLMRGEHDRGARERLRAHGARPGPRYAHDYPSARAEARVLPLLSYMGPAIAGVLTGSVVVEKIFGIPGLSQRFVLSALNRDYTVVLGIVILYASLVIVLNLLVDILYGFLDPRIRRR